MTDYNQLKQDILKCEEIFKKEIQSYNEDKVDVYSFVNVQNENLYISLSVERIKPPLFHESISVCLENNDFMREIKDVINNIAAKNNSKKI